MRNITAHFKSDSDVVKMHHLQLTEMSFSYKLQLQLNYIIVLVHLLDSPTMLVRQTALASLVSSLADLWGRFSRAP